MNGRIIVCLALSIALGLACESRTALPPSGVSGPSPEHRGTTMEFKVENWVERLAVNSEATKDKRLATLKAIRNSAHDPQLRPELKARIVDAIQKLLGAETDPEIIKSANETLGSLPGKR